MKILILNGPNLNLLGQREPDVYGAATLDDMAKSLRKEYPQVQFEFSQSNSEGELIDILHKAMDRTYNGVVINPGAYTHYSYAIRDAIASLPVPTIEVHISNVHKREEFRTRSVTAAACAGQIVGFGMRGYSMAVSALLDQDESHS